MRVLVTRAAEDALAFCHHLEAAGHEPVQVPLLERVWEVDALATFAREVPHADWLVITSAATAQVLGAAAPTAWSDARIAAVGPQSAHELTAMGRSPQVIPADHHARALADALPDLTGRVVIYPRADLAPPDLADALRAKGAIVHDPIAYVNREPPGARARLQAALPVDATPLLSGSAATRLAEALGHQGFEGLGRVLAIGPSTARAARAAGLPVHAVADPHTSTGLLTLIGPA